MASEDPRRLGVPEELVAARHRSAEGAPQEAELRLGSESAQAGLPQHDGPGRSTPGGPDELQRPQVESDAAPLPALGSPRRRDSQEVPSSGNALGSAVVPNSEALACFDRLLAHVVDLLKNVPSFKLPHHVIGHRNCGAPTAEDVLGRRGSTTRTSLPLQPKPLPTLDPDAILRLAEGTPLAAQMQEAWRLLNDASRYAGVPPVNLEDSSCSLSSAQVEYMRDIGFWTRIPADQVAKIRGVCRIFTIEEWFKNPPRARVISWAWTVNQDLSLKVKFNMFPQMLTRFLVWTGPRAVCIDGKSAFNQYPLSEEVGLLHAIHTASGWHRPTRSAMGARPTCFVADTSLRVLAQPIRSSHATYIDNLFMGDSPEELIRSTEIVRDRSAQCGYTWNEDLSDIPSLVKEEVEFLGTVLNMSRKTVALAPKVLGKLAVSWRRRHEWLIRDFIVCGCTLLYTCLVLGRPMGRWQKVLKYLAGAQGQTQGRPEFMEQPFVLPEEELRPGELSFPFLLEDWVSLTLTNEPLPVPELKEPEHDFLLITDASKHGWCAILISYKTGQATVLSSVWPIDPDVQTLVRKSAYAEPLATLAAVSLFFLPHVSARVLHVGDNSGQTGELNKGYSTSGSRFLSELLARHYPGIKVDSIHEPGETLPADAPSRGLRVDPDLLAQCASKFGADITEIRDSVL